MSPVLPVLRFFPKSVSMNKNLRNFRTFEDGRRVPVGNAENRNGNIVFRNDGEYLAAFGEAVGSLSPLTLPYDASLQPTPGKCPAGLPGFLVESLPDGYGLWLMDKAFQRRDVPREAVAPLDRLAFVGNRAAGALSYEPGDDIPAVRRETLPLTELGTSAQTFFDGKETELFAEHTACGSAGGSRPKAQLFFGDDFSRASLVPKENSTAWLVKFTASDFPLGHEGGLFEAAALAASEQAGIRTPAWRLFKGPQGRRRPKAPYWLGMERFDRTSAGRVHYVSAAGLLNADFREPVFDNFDLLRLTHRLTQSQAEMEELFRRAVLSYFLRNEDDHGKNFGFLLHDDGRWTLSPSFDITYAPGPYGEHATSFGGNGRRITRNVLERMSDLMTTPVERLEEIVRQTASAALAFGETALSLGAKRATVKEVKTQVESAVAENLKAMGLD